MVHHVRRRSSTSIQSTCWPLSGLVMSTWCRFSICAALMAEQSVIEAFENIECSASKHDIRARACTCPRDIELSLRSCVLCSASVLNGYSRHIHLNRHFEDILWHACRISCPGGGRRRMSQRQRPWRCIEDTLEASYGPAGRGVPWISGDVAGVLPDGFWRSICSFWSSCY